MHVEDGDMLELGHQLSGRADAREVGWVVERRERDQSRDRGFDLGINPGWLGEPIATVHDSMRDPVELDVGCLEPPEQLREHDREHGRVVGPGDRPA